MPPTSLEAARLLPVDTGPPPDASMGVETAGSPLTALSESPLSPDDQALPVLPLSAPSDSSGGTQDSQPTPPTPSGSPASQSTPTQASATSSPDGNSLEHQPHLPHQPDITGDVHMGEEASSPSSPPKQTNNAQHAATAGFTIGLPPPTPSVMSMGKKPTKKKTSSKASAQADRLAKTSPSSPSPSQPGNSKSDQHTIWSKAGTAQLRAKLSGTVLHPARQPEPPQSPPPDPALLNLFMCATKPANLRRDGDQRPLTTKEREALYAWMGKKLHLEEPPQFLMETHTSAERDSLAEFDRQFLGSRLHGVIPAGVNLPDTAAKYHLCHAALLACGNDEARRHKVLAFFNATFTITVDPKSMIMSVRFVLPTVRDAWDGFEFALGKGTVRMQATDSLTTAIPKVGFDPPARKLLYQVYFHGGTDLVQHAIRAIGRAAAGMPVLRIQLVQSIGLRDFQPTRWKLTFDQITCPAPLERVRRIQVVYDNVPITIDVHHPRASRRAPCTRCLSIRHATKDCKNKFAESSAACRTLVLEVPEAEVFQLTAPLSSKKFDRQLKALREAVAPDVARTLEAEEQSKLQKIERKRQRSVPPRRLQNKQSKTKAAAKRAAKEAAEQAKAQHLAREQVERDRKEQARCQTLQAHQRVRAQLRQVQQHARTSFRFSRKSTDSGSSTAPASSAAQELTGSVVAQQEPVHSPAATPSDSAAPSGLALVPYTEPAPQIGKRHEPPSPTASEAGPPASKARQFDSSAGGDDSDSTMLAGSATIRPQPGAVLDAPTVPDAATEDPKPPRRVQRQMPLSAFFAPQTLEDAQAQLEQEVAMRKLRPEDHWQSQFPSPLSISFGHLPRSTTGRQRSEPGSSRRLLTEGASNSQCMAAEHVIFAEKKCSFAGQR